MEEEDKEVMICSIMGCCDASARRHVCDDEATDLRDEFSGCEPGPRGKVVYEGALFFTE